MKLDSLSNPLGIDYQTPAEDIYITLNCQDCDFVECNIAKKWIIQNSKEGCTRKVNEDTSAQFYHYIKEVIPFWKMYDIEYIKKSYQEIINFLYQEIYNAPIGQRLDPSGKVRNSGY